MTVLGDILLEHYADSGNYADQAVYAAVEELEKHAAEHPALVAKVEMAMMEAGQVSVPYAKSAAVADLMREMGLK